MTESWPRRSTGSWRTRLRIAAVGAAAGLVAALTVGTAAPQRTPPPPGGAFPAPYVPLGPAPIADRANPPPPGGAFNMPGASRGGGAPSRGAPSRGAAPDGRATGGPGAAAAPPQASPPDPQRKLRSDLAMLRNYANARPAICREVVPRCEAILGEHAAAMTAEQLLEVARFATQCDAPGVARRALERVVARFPGTTEETIARAELARLPRS